jgi:hypothetical protein
LHVAGRSNHGLYSGVFLSGGQDLVQLLAHRLQALRRWPVPQAVISPEPRLFFSMAFSAS